VVHVPEGWNARSTPPLAREGATLQGSFGGLPADALQLATRAPVPAEYQWATWTSVTLFFLTVVAGGILCWWAGRRLGFSWVRFGTPTKSGAKPGVVPLEVLGFSGLWGAAVFVAGGIVPYFLMRAALHGQESPYFHEHFDALFCGSACLTT